MASGRYAIDRTAKQKAQIDNRDEELTFEKNILAKLHSFRNNCEFLRKKVIFRKYDLYWAPVTSIFNESKMT